MTTYERDLKFQSREQNRRDPQIREFIIETGFYFMAHTPRENGPVIWSKFTGEISAELAMQTIAIAIALRPDTGVVPIENNGTKRSVESQH